jgi:hypothetical protein
MPALASRATLRADPMAGHATCLMRRDSQTLSQWVHRMLRLNPADYHGNIKFCESFSAFVLQFVTSFANGLASSAEVDYLGQVA